MDSDGCPRPNILVTGTPGTGKTTLSTLIAERIHCRHVNVGEIVRLQNCHEGKDEIFDAYVLDEDKLCDVLESMMEEGGNVVDFHSCDFFPERWFDLVLVLRTNNTILYDRLQSRGYTQKKIMENVECEIMQVVLDEARESYPPEIVHELISETNDDMESNLDRVERWYQQWLVDHHQENP